MMQMRQCVPPNAWRQVDHDRQQLPRLLFDLSPKHAIPVLCRGYVEEKSTLTKWAIGRILRKAGCAAHDYIRSQLGSSDYRVRAAACEICGWLGPEAFANVLELAADEDLHRSVRSAAESTILRQQVERHARELIVQLKQASGGRRWSLLDALVKIADPVLLMTADDQLSLVNWRCDSPGLWQFLQTETENRSKELERDAEERDRKQCKE